MSRKLISFVVLSGACFGQTESTISGKITDAVTHQPIAGATVRYCCADASATTDPSGGYSLRVEVAGDSPGRFVVSKAGYARIDSYAHPGDAGNRDFELKPGAHVSGHIVDRDSGTPLAGFQVFARGRKNHFAVVHASQPSGTEGQFTLIGDLLPGDYVLEIAPPGRDKVLAGKVKTEASESSGYGRSWFPDVPLEEMAATLTVAPGESRDIEIRLRKRELHRISGVIELPKGKENDEAHVMVRAENGGLAADGHDLKPGPFHIDGIDAGTYTVFATTSTGALLSQTLEVTDRNIDDLKLTLRDPVSVQAAVTMLEDKVALPKGILFMAIPKVMGYLVSEPADSLVAEGLPPGSVWPVLIPPPGYAVTSVSYGGRPVVNTAFDAEARESTVSFVLTSRPAGVTGTVRDANQKPVPEAAVVILPEGMADVGDGTILLRVVLLRSSATSDANGVFHLGNLAPGRYRAVALRGNGDENAADWNFLRKKVSSGERVELDFGQTANLDLRVK